MVDFEVCVAKIASNMLMIYVYNSQADFEADKAVAVYIIPRSYPLFPPTIEKEDLEWLRQRYGNVEVIEDESKAVEIYERCERTRKFIPIRVL